MINNYNGNSSSPLAEVGVSLPKKTDEQLLRNAGLILPDVETGKEGITLAAILLFGSDELIHSVLPYYETDAIFRVDGTDGYDDCDVIRTNLLDSFSRLLAFGRKHLNDLFVTEENVNVSLRDNILYEIISNLLIHRDYSSTHVARMVIEKDRIFTENSSCVHTLNILKPDVSKPYPKNPAISRVFREIGSSDELGSGVRNTYKYTRLYSGADPQFIEGNIFRAIIPLNKSAITTVESAASNISPNTSHTALEDNMCENSRWKKIMEFCSKPRVTQEIITYLELSDRKYFRKNYLIPLLESGKLKMTIPDKPTSKNQKYVAA